MNIMGEDIRSYFWVTTLDCNNRKKMWDPESNLGPQGDAERREHLLTISQIMTETETRDTDLNVVEIETVGYKEQSVKFPIVVKLGKRTLMQLNLFFPHPPVIFHLVRGSGPVHLLGNHSVNYPEEEICKAADELGQEMEFVVVDEEEDSEEQEVVESNNKRENMHNAPQFNITKIRKRNNE